MVIRYPQNWVYDESAENYATTFFPSSEISFMSNNLTEEPRPNVAIVIGKPVDLPYRNMPLNLYFDYTKAKIISGGNNITSTGKTNLTDGTPAYEIQTINNNGTYKAVLVIMNNLNKKSNNSESYYFGYAASPDKFNTYLPIAQQVLKTLQICQLTESEKLMHAKKSCTTY
jgi:hypothetical protein